MTLKDLGDVALGGCILLVMLFGATLVIGGIASMVRWIFLYI